MHRVFTDTANRAPPSPTRRLQTMSDILNKIVAVKHEEVAAAKQRMPLRRHARRRREPRAYPRLRWRAARQDRRGPGRR